MTQKPGVRVDPSPQRLVPTHISVSDALRDDNRWYQLTASLQPDQRDTLATLLFQSGEWQRIVDLLGPVEQRNTHQTVTLTLARNLSAMTRHRPNLLSRITPTLKPLRYKIYATPRGGISIADLLDPTRPVSLTPGNEPSQALPKLLAEVETYRAKGLPISLLGIGDGYLLSALGRDRRVQAMGQTTVTHIVEPDTELLNVCMMLHDLGQPDGPIASPEFHWHIGHDWAEQLESALVSDLYLPEPVVHIQQHTQGPAFEARAQHALQARSRLEKSIASRVKTYYETQPTAALVQLLTPPTARPGRVCFLTSRFTTVLQHSTRDLAIGFQRIGWQTRTLIEPHNHSRVSSTAILKTLDEFKPDLFVTFDHTRASLGNLLPENLPHLCYIQDILPNLTQPQSASTLGPNDFVAAFCAPMLIADLGYPAQRTLDAPMMFAPCLDEDQIAQLDNQPQDGPDLLYISHVSGDPPILAQRLIDSASDEFKPLIASLTHAVLDRYTTPTGCVPSLHDLALLIDQHARKLGVQLDPHTRRRITLALWNPLNITLYRQQSLDWAADIADRMNLNLAIHGNGWEQHPRFARYARGPVANGPDLYRLVRSAKITFNLEPYPCISHVRLLSGLSAGAFFLVRDHSSHNLLCDLSTTLAQTPFNTARTDEELLSLLDPQDQRRWQASLKQAQNIGYSHKPDVVRQVRSYENAGLVQPEQPLLPRLGEIAFNDSDNINYLIERYIQSPDLRREIQTEQTQFIRNHLTAQQTAQRLLKLMRQSCECRFASLPSYDAQSA
ncbi:MAG: hypothetical protein GC164_10550 [Phycisphaera sp.]|nr:hypothetical protein [Phycisphaera sp.]